jgi:hypothetical protein
MQDHPVQHLLQAHGGRLPQAPHRKEAGQNTQGLQEGWRSSSKTKRIVKKSMINFQYVLFLLHHGLYLRLPMQADRLSGILAASAGARGRNGRRRLLLTLLLLQRGEDFYSFGKFYPSFCWHSHRHRIVCHRRRRRRHRNCN